MLGYENNCLDNVIGNYKTRQTYSYDNLYQLIKVEGETTYDPYHSELPEFVSNYSQNFEFDTDGLGNMTSKVSKESVSPLKKIGDNLNYNFTYVYDENFAHRLVRAGDRYYKYDSNGKIVWHADYEAFGNIMNERGEENFTPNYTGKFFDESSGLYYFNARWYDCELGRFTTQDPARDGVNWWAYCGGNPITFVDPTGMYNEENGYSKQEIKDFKKMNVQEQLSFLKTEVSSVTEGSTSAGTKSFYMRTQLKKFMNLEDLFNSRDGDEKFMNEDLRDFLNIKEDGSDYIISDMSGNGWKRLKWPADSEHQNIQNGGRNIKFVNEDGREAIFDSKGNFIKDTIDKGTFNYGKLNWYPASTHGRYDMKPFFRQNNIQPVYWRLRIGSNYGWNSK
ncbi:MAG: hypothetical protein J6J67_00240 [Treponema sp.]|nr:hypothetical protein [Treponema sp.]